MATGAEVYTGFWVNWSKGLIGGATITTNGQHGFYLVSFLTLFVRMVGGRAWSVLCFVIHQLNSTFELKDGLHHQHQLLIRNSQSHTSTIWDMMKVAWYWRKLAKHSFGRTLPLIALAATHLALFTAAAFFSSQIASTSDEVLILQDPYCGYLTLPNTTAGPKYLTQQAAYDVSTRMTATWSENYIKNCYLGSGDNSSCNLFAKAAIDLKYSYMDCPFGDEICLQQTNGAFQVDTGYINSDKDLGINSRKEHSVNYRRVTTCAPLKTEEPYSYTDTVTNPDSPTLDFFYGEAISSNGSESEFYTFQYPWNAGTSNTSFKPAYALYNQYAGADDGAGSSFAPIDALKKKNADLTLVFLVTYATYSAPVNDIWFKTHFKENDCAGCSPLYFAQLPVAVMACLEQHQLCDPTSGNCSPLTGSTILGNMELFPNPKQLAVVHHMYNAIDNNYLEDMTWSLGANALLANDYVERAQAQTSAALPDDQWVQEIKAWGAYTVAHMQRMIYQFAAGPQKPAWDQYIVAPTAVDASHLNVCGNQKIRSGAYYSFNLFGLVVTFVGGSLIVLLSLCLSTCVALIQKVTKTGIHKMEDWSLDHSLQVQRMAYENLGVGTWEGREALVPVTAAGERFGKPTRNLPGQRLSGLQMQAQPLFSPYPASTPSPYLGESPYAGTTVTERDPFFQQKTGYEVHVDERLM